MSIKKIIFLFAFIATLIALFYPFFLSNFFVASPDVPGLWCSSRYIVQNNTFFIPQIEQTAYNACWDQKTYPSLQILIALLSSFWNGTNIINYIIIVSSIIANLLCCFLLFFIVKSIWNNHYISFISYIFGITSLPASITLMLTPHNTYGYLLILLALYALIFYFKTRKKKFVILSVALAIPLYFFHQLSLFVYIISFSLFIFVSIKRMWLRTVFILIPIASFWLISIFYFKQFNPLNILHNNQVEKFKALEIHNMLDHPSTLGYFLFIFGITGLILFYKTKSDKNLFNLFLSFIIAPILFTLLPYFGWQIVPYRFILYIWIPLGILSGYGFLSIFEYIKKYYLKLPISLFLIILISTNLANYMVFTYHNFQKYSKPILLNNEIINALNMLAEKTTKNTNILAVYFNYNNQAILLPSFIDGNIYRFSSSLKRSDLFKDYFANTKNKDTEFYWEMDQIKNDTDMNNMINKYNLSYMIIWPDNLNAVFIENITKNRKLIYQSSIILIYEL